MSASRHTITALFCVAQDDVVSLRILCSQARSYQQNIDELDMYGNTALLKACYMGRYECARVLLDFGADIHAVNYFGQNALTLATFAGHLPLVSELLRHRTYKDFNLSSLIPAICVATMQQHASLEDYFRRLEPKGIQDLHTVHGHGVNELRQMVNMKFKKRQPQLFQRI
ncbi:DNA replication inhibitor plutonium [Drosophila sulfurigaster albostrigata]|uniref:DNA replication inhibitor plutonium n=1 Tax=Drosophila sulfurigaster albostrigata TaxID=89887 RepID=UPI002D21B990|nr:DNA replication inhibitor plutonium [Drosophila sulfurigaster albostrigata]